MVSAAPLYAARVRRVEEVKVFSAQERVRPEGEKERKMEEGEEDEHEEHGGG